MPELPEVETIARRLRRGLHGEPAGVREIARPEACSAPPLIGRTITGGRILWARTIAEPSPRAFLRRIRGQVVRDVTRRGKFLVLPLSRDTLLFHLRMGGGLAITPAAAPVAADARLVLALDEGCQLVFRNARKFGRVWLAADPRGVLGDLGPEPLDPRFRAADLHGRLQAHRRLLKPLLLDQTFLAGIGNIYADESLHRAGLHPLTLSHRVTLDQAARLWRALREVLRAAIRHNGTTFDEAYGGGAYLSHLRAYQRDGEPCLACGTPIRRTLVGQRGTHFCPICQRR